MRHPPRRSLQHIFRCANLPFWLHYYCLKRRRNLLLHCQKCHLQPFSFFVNSAVGRITMIRIYEEQCCKNSWIPNEVMLFSAARNCVVEKIDNCTFSFIRSVVRIFQFSLSLNLTAILMYLRSFAYVSHERSLGLVGSVWNSVGNRGKRKLLLFLKILSLFIPPPPLSPSLCSLFSISPTVARESVSRN